MLNASEEIREEIREILIKSKEQFYKYLTNLENEEKIDLGRDFKRKLIDQVTFLEVKTYISMINSVLDKTEETDLDFFKLGAEVNKEIENMMVEYSKVIKTEYGGKIK